MKSTFTVSDSVAFVTILSLWFFWIDYAGYKYVGLMLLVAIEENFIAWTWGIPYDKKIEFFLHLFLKILATI